MGLAHLGLVRARWSETILGGASGSNQTEGGASDSGVSRLTLGYAFPVSRTTARHWLQYTLDHASLVWSVTRCERRSTGASMTGQTQTPNRVRTGIPRAEGVVALGFLTLLCWSGCGSSEASPQPGTSSPGGGGPSGATSSYLTGGVASFSADNAGRGGSSGTAGAASEQHAGGNGPLTTTGPLGTNFDPDFDS